MDTHANPTREVYDKLEEKVQTSLDKNKPFDFEEIPTLHPALDYKNGIAIIGFRAKKIIGGKPEYKNHYLINNNGIITFTDKLELQHEGKTYYIELDSNFLPDVAEKWHLDDLRDYINSGIFPDQKEVFEHLKKEARKYFELSCEEDYNILVAWIIGTYLHRIFPAFPFLHIKAPKGSGKSQVLAFLEKAVFNGKKARATAASLGDIVTATRGTILFDQADCLHGENYADIKELITDSYKIDGGKRLIMDMQKGRKLIEFETYSPKAFASTIDLPQDMRDRCILLQLAKTATNYPVPNDENTDWRLIRGNLYKIGLNTEPVRALMMQTKKDYCNNIQLVGRTLDLWLPIEVAMRFCQIVDEDILKAREQYVKSYEFMIYEPKEYEEEVIQYIYKIIGDRLDIWLSPKEITKALRDERVKSDFVAEPGDFEILNSKKVGHVITNLNLSSKKTRKSAGILYLFTKEKIEQTIKTYFPIYEQNTN